jgi:hypothetical protein
MTALMASAQVKTPHFADLTTCFPSGGRAGTTVTVHLSGKALENPRAVIIEGDGIQVKSLKSISAAQVDAEVIIDPKAEPGIRGVRVTGTAGTSDPAWFVVGELPEALEQEPNDTQALEKALQLPAVMNARLSPAEDVDVYRFSARKGEKVNLSVACYMLDSQIMPGYRYVDCTLTVYSATTRPSTPPSSSRPLRTATTSPRSAKWATRAAKMPFTA